MKPLILFYNADEGKINKMRPVLALMGIGIKIVGEEQLFNSVGFTAYPEEYENKPEAPSDVHRPDFEFMLLCGMDQKNMNLVLDFMKKNKHNIAVKAMLTDTNKDWSFIRLLNEINAERKMMAQQIKSKK